jgi:hypothetical protein
VSLGADALLAALAILAALAFGPDLRRRMRARARTETRLHPRHSYDPGRERRAERRARELLRSVVGSEAFEMYRALGFLHLEGGAGTGSGYGYLIYPHRPIVAYEARSGELLNEYCVGFPDRSDPGAGTRLPDSDDVLAKWMALRGDERTLIEDANMHLPGRQVDPSQVRRDLRRLREWERRSASARRPAGAGPSNEQRETRNGIPA